jgi:hypothetical protein
MLKKVDTSLFFKMLVVLFFTATLNANMKFDNGYFRFGNGVEDSINMQGTLQQPFLYVAKTGEKLTWSTKAMFMTIGINGDGTNFWNINGDLANSQTGAEYTVSNVKIYADSDALTKGYGKIIWSAEVNINGNLLFVTNKYELEKDGRLLKVVTDIENIGTATLTNLRVWVGIPDDYFGSSDSTLKTRGNFVNGKFVELANSTDTSKVVEMSHPNFSEKIYLFSEDKNVNSIISRVYWLPNLIPTNPAIVPTHIYSDGAYDLYFRLNDLGVKKHVSFSWNFGLTNIDEFLQDKPEVVETTTQQQAYVPAASSSGSGLPLPNILKVLMLLSFVMVAFFGLKRR